MTRLEWNLSVERTGVAARQGLLDQHAPKPVAIASEILPFTFEIILKITFPLFLIEKSLPIIITVYIGFSQIEIMPETN